MRQSSSAASKLAVSRKFAAATQAAPADLLAVDSTSTWLIQEF